LIFLVVIAKEGCCVGFCCCRLFLWLFLWLGFQLRALTLLGKHYTGWAISLSRLLCFCLASGLNIEKYTLIIQLIKPQGLWKIRGVSHPHDTDNTSLYYLFTLG
jgi:hypothetical protein